MLSLNAVVHTDPDGSIPYTGWQEHRLCFKEFNLTCSQFEHGTKVDVYLSDGVVKLDGVDVTQLLSSNTRLIGDVEVSLWPSPNFQRLVITAKSLQIEPVGPIQWEREPPALGALPSA